MLFPLKTSVFGVLRMTGGQEVAGSTPVVPTSCKQINRNGLCPVAVLVFDGR